MADEPVDLQCGLRHILKRCGQSCWPPPRQFGSNPGVPVTAYPLTATIRLRLRPAKRGPDSVNEQFAKALYSCQSALSGCSPTASSSLRTLSNSGRFICSDITVALPVVVRPTMTMKSSLHTKCRDQRWRRGLKSGTRRSVSGSVAWVLVYLYALHHGHAHARLSNDVSPPASRGWICSQ